MSDVSIAAAVAHCRSLPEELQLEALERTFFELTRSMSRQGRSRTDITAHFHEAGITPWQPGARFGYAPRRIGLSIPHCEASLARLVGYEVDLSTQPVSCWIPHNSMLDYAVSWLPWSALFAMRAARGALGLSGYEHEPNYALHDVAARLAKSTSWVQGVVDALNAAGCQATSQQVSIRESVADIATYSQDETDVRVAPGFSIEVKSRNVAWTTPQDFPYDTMIVDTLSGYLMKAVRPLAYVCVSTKTGAMSVIPPFTASTWGCERKVDRRRQALDGGAFVDKYLLAPKTELRDFGWLVRLCADLHHFDQPLYTLSSCGYPADLARLITASADRMPTHRND